MSDYDYSSHASEVVSSDDDSDLDFRDNRQKRRDEATYGIFMGDDDDEDDNRKDHRRRFSSKSRNKTAKASAPSFVKGKTLDFSKEETDNQNVADKLITEEQTEKKQETKDVNQSKQEQSAGDDNDDDVEYRERQQQANNYFLSLLERGRGKMGARLEANPENDSAPATSTHPPLQEEDIQQQERGSPRDESLAALHGRFGGIGLTSRKAPKPAPRKDLNLGAWEKHTKGIGGKLLAKMGYTGTGGLGARNRGVTKPVEVKVRPTNLGLGFGNFKEATQLKTNREIEAEVRGIPLPGEQPKRKGEFETSSNTQNEISSVLPSVKEIMADQPWRRDAPTRKKLKRTIVPYSEILKSHSDAKVIDMRGPQAEVESVSGEVPLAEELLFNVSLLLTTAEKKLQSASSFVNSTEQKVKAMKSELDDEGNKMKQLQRRQATLENAQIILDRIEKLDDSSGADQFDELHSLVTELEDSFTEEERLSLKFNEVVLPTIYGDFIEKQLKRWDPMNDPFHESENLMRLIVALPVASRKDRSTKASELQKAMFLSHIIPRAKIAYQSPRWNPCTQVEQAVKLYELLLTVAEEVDPIEEKQRLETEFSDGNVLPFQLDDESPKLAVILREQIILDVVHNRINQALSEWKPQLTGRAGLLTILNRLDLWTLPWAPYLDHRALFPAMVSECRRKTKHTISFLSKSVDDDIDFCRLCIALLTPWRGVFSKEKLFDLVTSYISPRLARKLSQLRMDPGLQQDWTEIDVLFTMHGKGLMHDREFLSICEGELLPRWISSVRVQLEKSPSSSKTIAQNYLVWKEKILQRPLASQKEVPSSRLLQNDAAICCYFYAALLMIEAASGSDMKRLDELRPSSKCSYRSALARRLKEEKTRDADDLLRMSSTGLAKNLHNMADVEARVRLSNRGDNTPTFRDVVEEFARENEILFQPRIDKKTQKDGKQVFLFGKIPIYLDSNVIYANEGGGEWKPIALETLADRAKLRT